MNTQPFIGFPKIGRFSREVLVSEKIDGTNAQILIEQDGTFLCGSRTRWIVPGDDNYGFAKWAHENKDELMKLGPGQHFGEWWGQGIQRNYGLKEKRFSLFNASRWVKPRKDGPTPMLPGQEPCPDCCDVVPIIYEGSMDNINAIVSDAMAELIYRGSKAAPGFSDPEGIIIWHKAANIGFKKTLVNDHKGKTQ